MKSTKTTQAFKSSSIFKLVFLCIVLLSVSCKEQEEKPNKKEVSLVSKIIISSVATVAVGGLTWVIGKSSKGAAAAGFAAFAASYVFNR